MLISKKWLTDYVFLPDAQDPEELAMKLKLTTVEVEGIITQGQYLDNVVVGLVKNVEKHPDADRLRVCQVDIGNETVQIVCGGSNVVEGMKVALGMLGAKVLWHGEGEPVVLEKTKIRGVESLGMICGADEVGLSEMFPKKDEKEILDLSHLEAKAGTPLRQALMLDDVIFEIDNKSLSNRPDLWGHIGMAREIAAICRKEFKQPKLPALKPGKVQALTVQNDEPSLCGKYMGAIISGITMCPSPDHIQRRLLAVGIRPINAVVDVMNYVMLDLGQPLHAFDLERAKEGATLPAIIVRRAKEGEHLRGLDGKDYALNSEVLVIANETVPLAIAGIMGSEDSAVHDGTTSVIIESANFNASSIRKTSQHFNLRTEASSRFEKMLDPQLCAQALVRAVQLLKEIFPKAEVASNIVDISAGTVQTRVITMPFGMFAKKIGIEIDKKTIFDILNRLGFVIKEKKKNKNHEMDITVPSWRATKDILLQEDIIEEVSRIYGYDAIPSSLPFFPIVPPEKDPVHTLEREVRMILAHDYRMSEVYNYSFVSPQLLSLLRLPTEAHIELDNPIAKDRPLLRRYLAPGLIENAVLNFHRFDRVALFELGRTYRLDEPGERATPNGDELLPRQDHMLSIVYGEKGNHTPFFQVAEAIRGLMDRCGSVTFVPDTDPLPFAHTARSAQIVVNSVVVGYIAEIHPAVEEHIGLTTRIAVAEVSLTHIALIAPKEKQYISVSAYPAIERDIAFVVDRTVAHDAVSQTLLSAHPLIVSATLFDIYEGSHVESGKKSMAYRLTYRSSERTLQTEEVDAAHEKVITLLKKQFGAVIRA